jgi:hypothetical protein
MCGAISLQAQNIIDLISDARRSEKTDGTIIKLYRNDIYLDLGVGFDFYNEYFKFGTEIRMSYGFGPAEKRRNYFYRRNLPVTIQDFYPGVHI